MDHAWARPAALLLASLPVADAQLLGLTDPRLCYILDGILFLYAIIITALFFREKLTKMKEPPVPKEIEDIYNKLAPGQRDEYDVLKKGSDDPEKGGRRQQNRRKNPQDAVYSALQKDKMADAYSEIRVKAEGLNPATKDTYDALQMQPLPPR